MNREIVKQNIRTYDLMAEQYDQETADFWEKFPHSVIDHFSKSVRSGLVLDVGSGPGRDGLILTNAGLQVLCLDASIEMVQTTKQRGLPSILADLTKLPVRSGKVRGVWAYTSLLHITKTDMMLALSQCNRVLVKNGVLGLGLIEGRGDGYRWSAGPNLPRYFALYSQAEVYDLLLGAGFKTFYFERFQPKSKNYLNFLARKTSDVS